MHLQWHSCDSISFKNNLRGKVVIQFSYRVTHSKPGKVILPWLGHWFWFFFWYLESFMFMRKTLLYLFSSSDFIELILHAIHGWLNHHDAIYDPLCKHFLILVNFELFPILGAVFKQCKITSQQMNTYSSWLKLQNPYIIKKNPQNVEKNLESSFTLDALKLFLCIFFFHSYIMDYRCKHHQFNKKWLSRRKSTFLMNL